MSDEELKQRVMEMLPATSSELRDGIQADGSRITRLLHNDPTFDYDEEETDGPNTRKIWRTVENKR